MSSTLLALVLLLVIAISLLIRLALLSGLKVCDLRLRTGDRVFVFTSDSILEWSESLGGYRVLYYFSVKFKPAPVSAGPETISTESCSSVTRPLGFWHTSSTRYHGAA
jgi:hypothetical protein